jgi:hypothetical protein
MKTPWFYEITYCYEGTPDYRIRAYGFVYADNFSDARVEVIHHYSNYPNITNVVFESCHAIDPAERFPVECGYVTERC